eukprot:g5234.t1
MTTTHVEAVQLVDAAAENDVERIHELIRNGVSADCMHPQTGRRALHEAALHGNEKALRALISSGCNLRVKTMMGRETALHLAAMHGHEIILRTLLRRCSALSMMWNRSGQQAIHLALDASCCYTLLEYGDNVDPFVRDAQGRTPLATASERGEVSAGVVQMLQERQEIILRERLKRERAEREERRKHLEAARAEENALRKAEEDERLKRAYLRHRWK